MNNDYNLLKIFKTLYQERHLTRSAEKLNLSQPAVSHALNRLRDEWNDPLFVKVPKGVEPTPLAHSLSKEIFEAIAKLEILYTRGTQKDLCEYQEIIKIGATDYLEGVLLDKLLQFLLLKFQIALLLL